MPRRRGVVKSRPPRLTYGQKQTAMSSQNSMFDITSGPPSAASFLDALTFRFMAGLHFFRSFDSIPDSDLYFDSDEEEELFYPHSVAQHPVEPHPRIRQLTDEEAEKHAKQAAEEQRQRQGRSARNKRKKLRKKEKKRLEKESRNISAEADGDESQQAVHQIGAQAQETPPEAKKERQVTSSDDDSDEQEEETTEIAAEEETQQEEKGVSVDISGEIISGAISAESVETPDAPKKEDKHGSDEENRTDPMAEEYIHKSTELAEFGNRWAAAGCHEMAVRCFTEAIKLNPKERKLFGNRSFCYEKMQQYDKALSDAEVALLMEPKWVKGLFRKAKALRGLKRYNEASRVYKEVLKLKGSSHEALQELNQTQMLQLMEMGFTQEESAEALQSHNTLEAAIDALFNCVSHPVLGEATEEGEWIVQQASKPRTQHAKESGSKLKTQSLPKKSGKSEVFQVWVGYLAPTVTYTMLYELFSRVGPVYKVKMLLDQQSAFVNYAREEDCVKAVQCIHGMMLEGSALVVRFAVKTNTELGMSKVDLSDPTSHCSSLKRECFFWRTTGCTRQDCTFRHVPEHESIDKDKVTSGFGTSHM
ncbi:stress-induced-phosphoprotein 1 isoform X2 [Dunckerocampus dactyliophorus]|uniref:stress-induced-phosphoprotein 1 isoform X2 n=1 Tax=Dunckerocampus dactyliophorus TaxID=161453 RepID=UPI0024056415|nr:stress-induced-phosphoprotein 1 isoform X2 [Dunckerocampus dactyliophorus]